MKESFPSKWLKLGTAGRPHGLRGQITVSGRDQLLPQRIRGLVFGPNPESPILSTLLTKQKRAGSKVVITCENINNREQAAALVGNNVWIARQDLPVDDANEYLWDDLYGKSITTPCGESLGIITEVLNHGASDIIEITSQSCKRKGLFPFIDQYFDFRFSPTDKSIQMITDPVWFVDCWQPI